MFADVFSKDRALKLLKGKKVWFIGSSNMRAIYKDVLWLVNEGTVATQNAFKVKNEPTYFEDKRTSNDVLYNGRNYKESRVYDKNEVSLKFHFITRLYLDHFLDLIKSINDENCPDVILLNSCLWDLTRWGPDGVTNFKDNILKTMKFLKTTLPAKTKVIWKTTLPVSTSADGSIFVDEIKYIVPMLPWHILEANTYASNCASFFNYDVLDLHHHMRMLGHLRVKDGIHWKPIGVRLLTNIFLTHLCFCWSQDLPGVVEPSRYYIKQTTKVMITDEKLKNRVDKKENYFEKLFKKTEKQVNKKAEGIKNKVLGAAKTIFKAKNNIKQKLRNFNTYEQRVQNYNINSNNYSPNIPNTCNNFNQYRDNIPNYNIYGEVIPSKRNDLKDITENLSNTRNFNNYGGALSYNLRQGRYHYYPRL